MIRNIVNNWLHQVKPKQYIRPLTTHDFYWQHPSVGTTRRNLTTGQKHPHEKRTHIIYDEKTGKAIAWSTRPAWPIEYVWSFSTKDDELCKRITTWCFENCTGYWLWSVNDSSFFVEFGPAGSTGRQYHHDYFIGIDNEDEAMAFKLQFDRNPTFIKTEVEKREETC